MNLNLGVLVAIALASPRGPWTVSYTHPNGQVGRGRLLVNHTFDSIPCEAKQEFVLDEDGHLASCTVSRDFDYHGVEIAAHSFTLLHSPGHLYSTRIRRSMAFMLKSGNVADCDRGQITFNNAGFLEACRLTNTTPFGSISCRGKNLVTFTPLGNLSACRVNDAFHSPLLGSFEEGSSLGFHEDGSLRIGHLESPRVVGALTIRGAFSLHPNGKMATAVLAAPWAFGNWNFRAGTYLAFRESGSLSQASYVQAEANEPNGFRWSDTLVLYFDESGKVTSSKVDHHQTPATARPSY